MVEQKGAGHNDLPAALAAIDLAIKANTHIPDELYLAPRNLAIKAGITTRMGQAQQSDVLYRKGITLVDNMLQRRCWFTSRARRR